ncbi:hypothetical protein KCH_72410 [Kitasatospora cheerisanensis KCTC 2395]|uniref:Uncharacterized protein n=1 Tax=Kitasatospora cheerisanensis KCTC 2395 TaxID=1348663 RepID=A0A066YJ25_9ACTN|nr:hypothetical protein KCH_72410 [Kitasatospora cheerisanensis KCTC 2395]
MFGGAAVGAEHQVAAAVLPVGERCGAGPAGAPAGGGEQQQVGEPVDPSPAGPEFPDDPLVEVLGHGLALPALDCICKQRQSRQAARRRSTPS